MTARNGLDIHSEVATGAPPDGQGATVCQINGPDDRAIFGRDDQFVG